MRDELRCRRRVEDLGGPELVMIPQSDGDDQVGNAEQIPDNRSPPAFGYVDTPRNPRAGDGNQGITAALRFPSLLAGGGAVPPATLGRGAARRPPAASHFS